MLYRFKVLSNKYGISMGREDKRYSSGYVTGNNREEAYDKLMRCYDVTKNDIVLVEECILSQESSIFS